jgi:phosphonoacetaldehyde hydrolase
VTLRAVIFDWAGTIVDFGSLAPVIAMRRAFANAGVDIAEADVRQGMGLPKFDHVKSCFALPHVAQAWSREHNRAPAESDARDIFDALEPLMIEAGAARATLIPGALETVRVLRAANVAIGSTTGYTRTMMAPIAEAAADQGYALDVIVCAGETKTGRPSPLMAWKAMVELGVYPASTVVKVDDAPVGIAEGKAAGCFTIGVAATGNEMGLDEGALAALSSAERSARLECAQAALTAAGADLVIASVADLPAALETQGFGPMR